jgi:hypothetical protein
VSATAKKEVCSIPPQKHSADGSPITNKILLSLSRSERNKLLSSMVLELLRHSLRHIYLLNRHSKSSSVEQPSPEVGQ